MSGWKSTGTETAPDKRNRVSLGAGIKTPEGVRYLVKKNDRGQILLDPVVSVPAQEAWFYQNKSRLASFNRSVAEAEAGETVEIDLGAAEDE